MTLYTRNKLLLVFSILSALVAVFFAIALVVFFSNGDHNESLIAPFKADLSLWSIVVTPNSLSAIISLIVFSAYVPIVGFAVYFSFEKTKSPEMLYYIAILFGFFAESFRLCIPLFSLTEGYSNFLRFIGRAAFFGQMQVILAILVQGALTANNEIRDSDKYLGIISVVALIFAMTIPLDVTVIRLHFAPKYGFESLFATIRVVFTIICFVAMFLSNKSKESSDYKKATLDFLILCIGYILLLNCTTFIILIIGTTFFLIGTTQFFKNQHHYYMWK